MMTEYIVAALEDGSTVLTGDFVIRCHSCIYSQYDGNKRLKCIYYGAPVQFDDFCSKAGRRKE